LTVLADQFAFESWGQRLNDQFCGKNAFNGMHVKARAGQTALEIAAHQLEQQVGRVPGSV